MLIHLDLFSGIGGFALACQWAGIETIGFVEIDKYCQKVLKKHWPSVPIVEDIRDVEAIKKVVDDSAIRAMWHDCENKWPTTRNVNTPDRTSLLCRTEDTATRTTNRDAAILVTGGFPCQPFSVAGKREGEGDDRYLWPQTIAVIKEIKPQWVLLENVTGIINLALDTVLSDLEGAGYSYETLIIPACAVNAWHRRDRIWIVANSRSLESRRVSNIKWSAGIEIGGSSQDVANTTRKRQSGRSLPSNRGNEPENKQNRNQGRGEVEQYLRVWEVEPELGRVAHGIPHRVDRLKCLGNAIVPQVAYEIIRVIVEIDKLIPQ